MLAPRTRLLSGLFLVLVMTTLAMSGLAAVGEDPRNDSEDFYDAIDGAKCMNCHEGQGMRPMSVALAARYTQLPIGETTDLIVNIRNPWIHDLYDIQVTINTTLAPNLLIMTEDRPEALIVTDREAPLRWDTHEETFPYNESFLVQENATSITAYVRVIDAPLSETVGSRIDQPADIGLALIGPSDAASRIIGTGAPTEKSARIDGDAIAKQGFGDWQLFLWYGSGLDDEITVEYGYSVWYNATEGTEHTFYASGVGLRNGETTAVHIPVQITSEDDAFVDFRVQGRASFEHQPGTTAVDNGHFWRFLTMHTRGGDGAIVVQGATAPQITGFQVDVLNLMTRILGFVSAFLVPIAMVTGGLFGKKSRRAMNKWFGGARRRVLWHSAMSWAILAVATLHLGFAVLEAQFAWTKGLLWGGVGWALLVSLGVTGYFQVSMIKRWNYRIWRHVHLWSAVGVFVFAGMHTVVDGSDLQAVRDLVPWLGRLAWP